MLLLYEQRSSLLSAASGRGPYYNFPKLHWHSNSSEAVHVQEHDKIVMRDKVFTCLIAMMPEATFLEIIIPIQVQVNFFPATGMIDIGL